MKVLRMRKITALVIAAMMICCMALGSCGAKEKTKTEEKKAQTAETAAAVSASNEDSSLPEDEFSKLPEEAEEDFDYVSKLTASLFPDAKGKKMYGFKGVEEISTADGTHSCYIFDYYTYKSKVYNKIATLAKDIESSAVFVLSDEDDGYFTAELPEEERHWHDEATANILVNGGDIEL